MPNLTPTAEEKKKYEKPAVIHTQVMEAIAGACDDPGATNAKTGVGDLCTQISS